MKPEFGRLKLALIAVSGMLTYLQTPAVNELLPGWLQITTGALNAGVIAVFLYLVKPPPSTDFKKKGVEDEEEEKGD